MFYIFQECRKRRKFIIICILSPNITVDDINYPDMKEVLQNVTYLKWPPKKGTCQTLGSPEEFQFFWRKLYNDIVKHDTKRYPNISVVAPNGNIPV